MQIRLKSTPAVIKTIQDYRAQRLEWYRQGLTVGFVPTMGALHQGHTSLAALARTQCDKVVASIFVNPAQFAPHEDLSKYPRTFENDLKLLGNENVDIVFAPDVPEMYPKGIPLQVDQQIGTFVTVQGKSHQMEGRIRPHFFRGVATVVSKLFNIIQPTRAYFGQKDVQQCSVVKSLVRDMHYPIQIVVGNTIRYLILIREPDGLAMSSRNRYLSEDERKLAPALYAGLLAAQKEFDSGQRSRKCIIQACENVIKDRKATIEYLSLAEPFSLSEVEEIGKEGAILSGAIVLGKTRIIDNILLGMPNEKL